MARTLHQARRYDKRGSDKGKFKSTRAKRMTASTKNKPKAKTSAGDARKMRGSGVQYGAQQQIQSARLHHMAAATQGTAKPRDKKLMWQPAWASPGVLSCFAIQASTIR